MAGKWDTIIDELRETMSYRDIAKHLNIPLGTVASTVARLEGRDIRQPRWDRKRTRSICAPQRWTDRALTETWAERKLRRQIERTTA